MNTTPPMLVTLPQPPQPAIEVVNRLPLGFVVIAAGRSDLASSVLEAAGQYATYVQALGQRLGAVVNEVERTVDHQETLRRYAETLFEQEQLRRLALTPVLVKVRHAAAMTRITAGETLALWNKGLALWDAALVRELEILRDARLRVEFKKVNIINAAKGQGKVVRSGTEVRIYFRRLRDDATPAG